MNKADIVAFEYTKENGTLGLDYNQIYDAVKHGYHQAEKDLELTIEDIRTILNIENDILRECNSHKELVIETYPKGKDYYGEILKRFKEQQTLTI